MNFEQSILLSKSICSSFWTCVNDSYRIEQMYDEYENVQVTLKDRMSTCRFIYFNGETGRAIRVLNEDYQYVGVLWIGKNGRMGGSANGEREKRKVVQCLTMFEKSLEFGVIEMTVERNQLPPSFYVSSSERVQIIA